MESDAYSRTGCTHLISQDYALAGTSKDGKKYGFISDGCSGKSDPNQPGSPFTDWGARFIIRSAQRQLEPLSVGLFPHEAIIHEAAAMCRQAELPRSALDATLLGFVNAGNEYTHVYQTGDGVIAFKKRDGTIHYTTRRFGNNAPYYLSYQLDVRKENDYFHPDPETNPGLVAEAGTVEVTNGWYVPGQGWQKHTKKEFLLSSSPTFLNRSVISSENTELLLLMTDGAESFQQKANGLPVSLEDVLFEMFDIRKYNGSFITRNCDFFFRKICVQKGWQHTDDFSITGLYMGAQP